jgi:hypothetical protein
MLGLLSGTMLWTAMNRKFKKKKRKLALTTFCWRVSVYEISKEMYLNLHQNNKKPFSNCWKKECQVQRP